MKKLLPYIIGYFGLVYIFTYYTYGQSFSGDQSGILIQTIATFITMLILPLSIYLFSKSFKAFKISFWVIFIIISFLTKGAHWASTNPIDSQQNEHERIDY